jgi:AhpD family alkylhydroperoxidase
MNSNDNTKAPCSNSQPTDANSVFTEAIQELVAISAAIAANCEPCFKFHYDKARKLGVSKEDIIKSAEIAKMVKDVSAKNMLDLAGKYLGNELSSCTAQKTCCS